MSKEENIEITSRFSIALISLLALKKFENKAEIANFLGCTPQVLSEVLKNRMQVQPYMLQKLILKYPESLQFVLTGKELDTYEQSLKASGSLNEPSADYSVAHREPDVAGRFSEWMRTIEARLKALETKPKT